jgi:transposase
MEGTGSFGAGLLRFLSGYGLTVIEAGRPDRARRRRNGKSDPLDAESAARAVQSGRTTGTPRSRDAQVEMIRMLRVARRGAMKARIQAGPASAVKTALRALARRWQALQAEIDDLDTQLTPLVTVVAPVLLALPGAGVETAGQLLVTAGDNRDRLRSEASFARLCGQPRSRCPPGGQTGTGCTAAGTGRPPAPCGGSRWFAWAATRRPGTTVPAALPRQDQDRDHARPLALYRPRGLPAPARSRATCAPSGPAQ